MASELTLLPYRRKTPKKTAQPGIEVARAAHLRQIGGTLGPKKR